MYAKLLHLQYFMGTQVRDKGMYYSISGYQHPYISLSTVKDFCFLNCFLLLLSLFLVNCSKENPMGKLFRPVRIFHTQEICVDMSNCPASFSAMFLVGTQLQECFWPLCNNPCTQVHNVYVP